MLGSGLPKSILAPNGILTIRLMKIERASNAAKMSIFPVHRLILFQFRTESTPIQTFVHFLLGCFENSFASPRRTQSTRVQWLVTKSHPLFAAQIKKPHAYQCDN